MVNIKDKNKKKSESKSMPDSEFVRGQKDSLRLQKDISQLGAKEKLNRLKWSVAVRYIMISAVAIITLVGHEVGFQFDLIGVLIASTIAFIFNLTSNLVYQSIYYPRFWPYIGIFLDMIVITLIVHATGGIESIFLPLYLLQLVGTNVHFSKIAAPLNLVFGGGLFVTLVILEYTGGIPHVATGVIREQLYLNEIYFFGVAFTMITLMGISTYRSGYVVRSLQTVEGELLKANQELIRLNKIYSKINRRLKEIDQMKTEFISVASHQMRTPLSGVKWVLRMILDGDLGDLNSQQREMLNKGYQTNERMIALINDLLNVSRIEEGRFQYRFVRASLEDVVDRAVRDLRVTTAKKKVKLEYNEPDQGLPKVSMDVDKISLAIQNLVDNASKYTPQGGKIIISLKHEDQKLIFSISDTGVGIPAEQHGRIFSKFFRADNVIRMQTDGSGLGLFISKAIIENHKGSIWFESTEGKGTTFYFSLPVQSEHEADTEFDQFINRV